MCSQLKVSLFSGLDLGAGVEAVPHLWMRQIMRSGAPTLKCVALVWTENQWVDRWGKRERDRGNIHDSN